MTFHGPGQLVGYPILDLNHYKKDLTWYVCALENSIIQFLKESYQLNAHTTENVGVWMERQRKIAAIGKLLLSLKILTLKFFVLGFHCSRWITSHGFSLNLNVDLDWYSHFVPCGLTDKQVTSIYEELKFKNSKTKNDDNFITENFMQYELPSFLETISNNFLSVPMFSLDQVYPELSEEIRRLVK